MKSRQFYFFNIILFYFIVFNFVKLHSTILIKAYFYYYEFYTCNAIIIKILISFVFVLSVMIISWFNKYALTTSQILTSKYVYKLI